MSDVIYLTQEGLEKLRQELQELKTEGRSRVAKAIAEARDKGDLSENAEYDAAKDAQGHHEAKIAKLTDILAKVKLIDVENLDVSKITILSRVSVQNLDNKAKMKWTIVSETEADLKMGKISVSSPIAKGLLGKVVNDIAEIEVPTGTMRLKILDISR